MQRSRVRGSALHKPFCAPSSPRALRSRQQDQARAPKRERNESAAPKKKKKVKFYPSRNFWYWGFFLGLHSDWTCAMGVSRLSSCAVLVLLLLLLLLYGIRSRDGGFSERMGGI